MSKVIGLYLDANIRNFKCATIAEAEMLAQCGVDFVLLAHQPVATAQERLLGLAKKYRKVEFGAIADDPQTALGLSSLFATTGRSLAMFVDIDNGMRRTGITVGPKVIDLYELIASLPGLTATGLHVYDGHIRDSEIEAREQAVNDAFEPVDKLVSELVGKGYPQPLLIAGGTPSFPVHAKRSDRICSPGTSVFWDQGYGARLPDLDFVHAAVLLTRVISKLSEHRVCVDLGHKAVAAESPAPRVKFLNLEGVREVGHSEEHLVLESETPMDLSLGDVLYAIPHHICPTVALHQQAYVVENGVVTTTWPIDARNRWLTV